MESQKDGYWDAWKDKAAVMARYRLSSGLKSNWSNI